MRDWQNFFTAQDCCGDVYQENLLDLKRANEILREEIAKNEYGPWYYQADDGVWSEEMHKDTTHKARLICIEPISPKTKEIVEKGP